MDDEINPIGKLYENYKVKLNRWWDNIKSTNAEKATKQYNPSFKVSFDHLFPRAHDLPERREEKFNNLIEVWRPKNDLITLTRGPEMALCFSGCLQIPFLFYIRKLLKIISYNRIMAVTSSVAFAAGTSYGVTLTQLDAIIRGEVDCAECHLVRTGAYQLVFTSLFPTCTAILISTFSAFVNPGIVLPVDVLHRWPATKEGLKIIGRALNNRRLIIGFTGLAFANVSCGVGLIYLAMKQYHDVHSKLLADYNQTIII